MSEVDPHNVPTELPSPGPDAVLTSQQESGHAPYMGNDNVVVTNSATENLDIPPPKPPRPMSPMQQAEATLIEAFPDLDSNVIRAVLVASGGKVEPAFNGLLSMSDPSFQIESIQPQQYSSNVRSTTHAAPPPRISSQREQDHSAAHPQHSANVTTTSTSMSQLEADELYARQLADHYGGSNSRRVERAQRTTDRRQQGSDDEDAGRSFMEDDLPVIRENIRQGFLQTQTKVNKWVTDFKKRIDGEPVSPDEAGTSAQSQYPQHSSQNRPQQTGRDGAYDADPRVLDSDFSHLELRDNSAPADPDHRPRRPLANPNLFTSRPSNDDDLYARPAKPPRPDITSTSGSKWEPLRSVEPQPEGHDPFSLADSDDEREKDLKPEATERLKRASMDAGPVYSHSGLTLGPSETVDGGVRDKTAVEKATT